MTLPEIMIFLGTGVACFVFGMLFEMHLESKVRSYVNEAHKRIDSLFESRSKNDYREDDRSYESPDTRTVAEYE